jgi:hypothetical protein
MAQNSNDFQKFGYMNHARFLDKKRRLQRPFGRQWKM